MTTTQRVPLADAASYKSAISGAISVANGLVEILDADRILVFDEGKIVEEGTHAQLVAKENGIYAGFFQLQSGGFIVE